MGIDPDNLPEKGTIAMDDPFNDPMREVMRFIQDAIDNPNPPTDEEIGAALVAKGHDVTAEEVRMVRGLFRKLQTGPDE
jgi:hypothetical protein